MGCKSSTLAFSTPEIRLKRCGLEKYDKIYEEAEIIIAEVLSAHVRLAEAADNFALLTGATSGGDFQLCYGLLALVIAAIAQAHGDWNDIDLSFSEQLPGIYMNVQEPDLVQAMEAWTRLCNTLLTSLEVVTRHKFTLCRILKDTRLAADYMAKDAFDDNTPISTFRGHEDVALENDQMVQTANNAFQNLSLSIIEIAQEATYTIEGISAFDDPSTLRKIAKKAEDAGRTAPNQVLQLTYRDLEGLVQEYKQTHGL